MAREGFPRSLLIIRIFTGGKVVQSITIAANEFPVIV